jgi:hypothetical protein
LSLSFSAGILWDYVYQQHPDGTYKFDSKTDDFELRDRNAFINTILNILHQIYANIITTNGLPVHKIDCNTILLDQALNKYSRDIYGELRLKARIGHLRLTESQNKNLSQFGDYGLKIDSTSPYVHRELAVLLYWLSVLKPFSIEPSPAVIKKLGLAANFHNEYISYLLIQAALRPFNHRLTIHANIHNFYEFLYDLHYRNLSRSSLEFFLTEFMQAV